MRASRSTRACCEAKGFYGAFAGLLVVAGVVTLLPGAPLGLITLAVQAMCGLMLPSTTIFVLLLCNDREVLGPVGQRDAGSTRWRVVIVTVLVVLSITMMVSTLFTVGQRGRACSTVLAHRRRRRPRRRACRSACAAPGPRSAYDVDRRDWRTPRLTLARAAAADLAARRVLLRARRHLPAASPGLLLVVRIVQLATS